MYQFEHFCAIATKRSRGINPVLRHEKHWLPAFARHVRSRPRHQTISYRFNALQGSQSRQRWGKMDVACRGFKNMRVREWFLLLTTLFRKHPGCIPEQCGAGITVPEVFAG